MKLKLVTIALGAAVGVSVISPAFAAPGDHGSGYGGCVDNFYGNATNERPSGHGVLPSQSPGPWVNNPLDPDNPTPGPSLGDVMQVGHTLGATGHQVLDVVCTFP